MLGNGVIQETQLLQEVVDRLADLLPPTWSVEFDQGPRRDRRGDGLLLLRTPQGSVLDFMIEAKLSTGRPSVQNILHQVAFFAEGRPAVVVTDYANPALRQGCEAAGVGYIDLTGWVYLRDDDAGLFVRNRGAMRPPAPPTPRGSAMTRLDGPSASQIVRTLWAAPLPVGVRELAAIAGVSPGTAAKVLPTLAAYGAVVRNPQGAVTEVNRRLLIERWTQDYGIYATNREVLWLLSPRGTDYAYSDLLQLRAPLGGDDSGIALTGYMGGMLQLPKKVYSVIPHSLLSIYSEDPRQLADSLGLRKATPTTANVVLIRPKDAGLLQSYPLPVPLPQVLADLLTMGGRFPELAEQLFEIATAEAPST